MKERVKFCVCYLCSCAASHFLYFNWKIMRGFMCVSGNKGFWEGAGIVNKCNWTHNFKIIITKPKLNLITSPISVLRAIGFDETANVAQNIWK